MKFGNFGKRNELASDIAIGSDPQAESDPIEPAGEKHNDINDVGSASDDNVLEKIPTPNVQAGIQKIEAVTLSWTKKELYMAYAAMLLVFFIVSYQEQTGFNLASYATSAFYALPLVTTTSIMSSIIGGVFRLPTAKFIDLVGRPEGIVFMTICVIVGNVMMAACNNVETYAAGQVFYWVGLDGVSYVLDVFVADTSSLKNRAFFFSLTTTPYIVTTWIGSLTADSFLKTSGWRWGYGVWAIVTPVCVLPIVFAMYRNERKAKREGLLPVKEKSGRTYLQSVNYYFWEFDFIGILLISAGFVLILLPFSLASYQAKGYHAPMIIAMFTIGAVCLVAFPLYEKFLAPKSFIPFSLLLDRSVMTACLLAMFLFISFYQWDSYFSAYLQAVHGLDVTYAGYVTNIYSIGSCFWGVILGLMIKFAGRFKYIAVAHLCLEFLGVGLMIHFRQPNIGIGYVVMCQIFIAFGGGGLVICEEMAVMAAAPHAGVAGVLALIALFSSVGGGIGLAIAGNIYTSKFPAALERALPGNATLLAELYGSLDTQLEYAFGTPERDAVLTAYGEYMHYASIVALAFLVPCFLFILSWKDFKLKDMRQVKGRVA